MVCEELQRRHSQNTGYNQSANFRFLPRMSVIFWLLQRLSVICCILPRLLFAKNGFLPRLHVIVLPAESRYEAESCRHSAESHLSCTGTTILAGSKRLWSFAAEAKYDRRSRQAAKIGRLIVQKKPFCYLLISQSAIKQ